MNLFARKSPDMPDATTALPGRREPLATADSHFVNGRPLWQIPVGFEAVLFGMGCFWGAERLFWQLDGVWVTSVGYAGGYTQNPTYHEVCTGQTGHTEVVQVVYDPAKISFEALLKTFWENHDPTQGMRQGNDLGTQYRSAVFTSSAAQAEAVRQSRDSYNARLAAAGLGAITSEIAASGDYFPAEDYHQQYLARNPAGYCGIGGTGVACAIGLDA